jgi:hypothetical protein
MSALPTRDQIEAFISYATSGTLSDDEIYTIELLIDRARKSYDPGYWDRSIPLTSSRPSPTFIPGRGSASNASGIKNARFARWSPFAFFPTSGN